MDAWQELGVSEGASAEVVRHAWRRAARDTHPDRGGDPAVFNRKRQAWGELQEVLGLAPRGRAVTSAAWTRARAIERAVELDMEVAVLGSTTGVTAGGDVLFLGDGGLEVDGWAVPWSEVDDQIMWSAFDLGGAAQPPQD